MLTMKIALAADHAGYEEKEKIKKTLEELGVEYEDMGTNSCDSVDYPDYAQKVGEAVARGDAEQGLLVCGSGTGMAIAANKVPGVRAAAPSDETAARLSREHNDANVLALGQRLTGPEVARDIVTTFLDTPFNGGRHQRRVDKINALDRSHELS